MCLPKLEKMNFKPRIMKKPGYDHDISKPGITTNHRGFAAEKVLKADNTAADFVQHFFFALSHSKPLTHDAYSRPHTSSAQEKAQLFLMENQ